MVANMANIFEKSVQNLLKPTPTMSSEFHVRKAFCLVGRPTAAFSTLLGPTIKTCVWSADQTKFYTIRETKASKTSLLKLYNKRGTLIFIMEM